MPFQLLFVHTSQSAVHMWSFNVTIILYNVDSFKEQNHHYVVTYHQPD